MGLASNLAAGISIGLVLGLAVMVAAPQVLEQLGSPGYSQLAEEIASKMDYMNPTVRNFAIEHTQHSGEYSTEQVCDIYDHIIRNWGYRSDPAESEYFACASESIGNGLRGDCDDFAILMAACVQAIGGKTRVVLANGHAWAEVHVENLEEVRKAICQRYETHSIHYHQDPEDECWLNLDWWTKTHFDWRTKEHPGLPFYQASEGLVVYPDGRWKKMKFVEQQPEISFQIVYGGELNVQTKKLD